MADYLEAYAARFSLPVRTGVRVDRVSKTDGGLLVTAGHLRIQARHVVVAMANYQRPRVPAFAAELDRGIVQLHSSAYRSPVQLHPGGVLIVGLGNSGAEIALETARSGHPTWIAGRDVGSMPFNIKNFWVQRVVLPMLFRVVFHRILTVGTPMGRKVRGKMISAGLPRIPSAAHRTGQRGRALGRQSHRREGRTPAAGQRPQPRCAQRHLVHGLRPRAVMDRSADFRGERRTAPDQRPRRRRAGSLFRRPALPALSCAST